VIIWKYQPDLLFLSQQDGELTSFIARGKNAD
jgi:hypothetical protein